MSQDIFIYLICAALVLVVALFAGRRIQRVRLRDRRPVKPVILDGSNIMHWDGGTPRLKTVEQVLKVLIARGYTPGVVFDANAGHLLFGRYLHDRALSRHLGLPEKHVMVVPKGTPADPFILEAARDMQAVIVSNDRFRDWAEQYPEIRRKGHLIRGSCTSGHVKLHLPRPKRPVQAPPS